MSQNQALDRVNGFLKISAPQQCKIDMSSIHLKITRQAGKEVER